MSTVSPIDAVLGGATEPPKRRRVLRVLAWSCALVVHAAVVIAAMRSGPSLEAWSAGLALEVHEALVDDQVIELATPPAAEPPTPPVAPRHAAPATSHHPSTSATAPTPEPPPPTEAAPVVVQEVDPDALVDLTGTTVVTGNATVTTGGANTTDQRVVGVPLAAPSAPPTAPTPAPSPPAPVVSLGRPVQLDTARWRCAWPDEATSQDIDEQAVVLRVVVLSDGSVEAAQLIDDPGHGFGRAALACAKRTSFTPALDPSGQPTRALSPPIRVRFTR